MIVTIVHAAPPDAGVRLAGNLALLRARHGRRVLLLDADPERGRERSRPHPSVTTRTVRDGSLSEALERLLARHDDVVIDAGGDGPACRSALIAAQVALVPLAPEQADADARYGLIARLNHARMFNPGLRVLFVMVGGASDPAPQARCAVRAYAAQVMSAGVAGAVLHLPDFCGAADVAALYEEVYQAPHAPPPSRRGVTPDAARPADGRLLQQ